ncbi:hypothetical protein [Stackebrandtia soli]|uniref:hypothetical protein n=1 Tax=Stackebrandtia soli TaxID=1892856 RepID=UPI0039E9E706
MARLSRRALLLGGVVGLAGCTTTEPEQTPSSPPRNEPVPKTDDIPSGITVLERGYSVYPTARHDHFMNVGLLVENHTTDHISVSGSIHLLDKRGQILPDGGSHPILGSFEITPKSTGGGGEGFPVTVEALDHMDKYVLWLDFDVVTDPRRTIVPTIDRCEDRDAWPLIHFTADNTGVEHWGVHYSTLYRDDDGEITGGHIFDRYAFPTYKNHLPEGEDEYYPEGTSTHALPCSYPPDQDPANTTMYLWWGEGPDNFDDYGD